MARIYVSILALYLAFCVIICMVWILTIYKLCSKKQSQFKHEFMYNFYRIVALVFYTSCLGCGIFDTLHIYVSWKNDYLMLGPELWNIRAAADALYFITSCSLNMMLFGRVYFTFMYSSFALSTCAVIIVTFQIMSSGILDCMYVAVILIYGSQQSYADRFGRPVILGIQINDLTVSISMLYLFSYKLKQLVISSHTMQSDPKQCNKKNYLQFKEASSETQSQNHTMNSVEINEQQPKSPELNIMVVVTRHTIVSGFAIFFNQLFYQLSYASMRTKIENSNNFGLMIYGARMLGVIGMMISIYFGMTFATQLYFKCCQCCHLTCYKCCIQCTHQTIHKNDSIKIKANASKKINLLDNTESYNVVQTNSTSIAGHVHITNKPVSIRNPTETTEKTSVIGNVHDTDRKMINIGEHTSTESNKHFPVNNKIGEPSRLSNTNKQEDIQSSSIMGNVFVTNQIDVNKSIN